MQSLVSMDMGYDSSTYSFKQKDERAQHSRLALRIDSRIGLMSVHPLRTRMTRFLDPLWTAWEQSNSHWILFNIAIYPLGQWGYPPGHGEIAHCTPQDSASLDHPLGQATQNCLSI